MVQRRGDVTTEDHLESPEAVRNEDISPPRASGRSAALPTPGFQSSGLVKVEVVQSCPTLCDPMYCSPPGSSVHGILQLRILE